jgi:hypothetical protein
MFVLEGHVAYTGDMRNTYTVLVGTLEEWDSLGDLGICGRIILKWNLKNKVWESGLDLTGSACREMGWSLEHGTEHSGKK